jgi:hypothetical protein
MVFKTLLLIIVISILMEDSASIRKTEEEKRKDEELARVVNATLEAEEEKKRESEKKTKKRDKAKTGEAEEEKKIGTQGKERASVEQEGQDEACPTCNCTCPIVKPCKRCPEEPDCPSCEDCPLSKECGPCPKERECSPCKECPEVKHCWPCGPCPVVNSTSQSVPEVCPEPAGMSVQAALVVGACAGGLLTGVAAVLGLVIRYFSPLECGFVFLATIVIVWYFSSQYPETARELDGRLVATLREATIALGHRVMEAIHHHQEQVGFPV